MDDLLHIEIATPEKLVASQPAEYAEIPGKDGYMGILPGHAALLSELGDGELSYTRAGLDRASRNPRRLRPTIRDNRLSAHSRTKSDRERGSKASWTRPGFPAEIRSPLRRRFARDQS